MNNKILVPTDFSPIADNAIDYAIEVAAQLKSELYLYHVYSFDRFNYDLDFHEDEQPYTKKVEQNMNKTKLKFMAKIKQKGLSVRTIVERDSIFSLFRSSVKKHGIDLVIMGSKGASGFEKVIFGSVAATAIEMSKVPVLVVPPTYTFYPLEQIVLALDKKEVSLNTFSLLQKLAFEFEAKVTILNVNSDPVSNAYREMDLYLNDIETKYHEVPMSNSINESINEFIREEGCDLLCMVRREKGFLKSLFGKSITRTQVFNNQVPLLALPEV